MKERDGGHKKEVDCEEEGRDKEIGERALERKQCQEDVTLSCSVLMSVQTSTLHKLHFHTLLVHYPCALYVCVCILNVCLHRNRVGT